MATLTSTITEEININGVERGATRSASITGVNDTFNRIVTCPVGVNTSVVTFQTAVNTSTGAVDVDNVKYMRVSNLSASNSVVVSMPIDTTTGPADGVADDVMSFKLAAGRSFIFGSALNSIAVDSTAATPIAAASLVNVESISVNATTADAIIEVFIAS